MAKRAPKRFCPVCGESMTSLYCPSDGAVTVVRDEAMNAHLPLEIGDKVNNRYEITAVIGRGGFGAVYAARHLVSGQELAIKILLTRPTGAEDEAERRFHKEARVLARLSHPNTVRVYDVGYTPAGHLFVAMELLRGPNLEQVFAEMLARGVAMTEPQAIDVAVPVLGSLAEAHGLDLVHRDMKPANIVLTHVPEEPFVVKVLDFGIVRTRDSDLTRDHAALGTPAYMSPEQCHSETVDGRSDLYSVGVILFEAVCGHPPYKGRNAVETMYQQMETPPPDVRSCARVPLSDAFVAIVGLALAKRPEQRFADAREMRAALQSLRAQDWGTTPGTRLRDLVSARAIRGPNAPWRVVVGRDSDPLQHTTAGPRVGTGAGVGAARDVARGEEEGAVTGLAIGRERPAGPVGDTTEHGLPSFEHRAGRTRSGLAVPETAGPVPRPPPDNAGEFAAPAGIEEPRSKPVSQMARRLPTRAEIDEAIRLKERELGLKERDLGLKERDLGLEAGDPHEAPTVRELEPGLPRVKRGTSRARGKGAGKPSRVPQMAPPSAADEAEGKPAAKLGKGTIVGTGLTPADLERLANAEGPE